MEVYRKPQFAARDTRSGGIERNAGARRQGDDKRGGCERKWRGTDGHQHHFAAKNGRVAGVGQRDAEVHRACRDTSRLGRIYGDARIIRPAVELQHLATDRTIIGKPHDLQQLWRRTAQRYIQAERRQGNARRQSTARVGGPKITLGRPDLKIPKEAGSSGSIRHARCEYIGLYAINHARRLIQRDVPATVLAAQLARQDGGEGDVGITKAIGQRKARVYYTAAQRRQTRCHVLFMRRETDAQRVRVGTGR